VIFIVVEAIFIFSEFSISLRIILLNLSYEINAYTIKPNNLMNIKRELISNILSDFKKANIENSPAHVAIRNSLSQTGLGS
jgi:hypothetical protein